MHTQAQGEMPFLGQVRGYQMLPADLVKRATFNGLLSEAARYSGKDDQTLGAEIHVSQGYMSRCMRGVFDQWAKRFIKFVQATGSLAPFQKIADELGCDLVVRSAHEAEKLALIARLKQLEGRVA